MFMIETKQKFLLSEEWRQRAKKHLNYMRSRDKYTDRPLVESRDGIALILEALLSL